MQEREKTILGRFRALRPWQRVLLGTVGMVFSTAGFFLTDPDRVQYRGADRQR